MVADALAAYARDIAPQVDRLAIAVHKHGRPAGAALFQEFGLRDAGLLIDARAILLSGPITLDDVAVIERYAPRTEIAQSLEMHTHQGLLSCDDTTGAPLYESTTLGRDLLLRLTEVQGRTITALWAVHEAELSALVLAATRVTDRAAATLPLDRYPAFRGQHAAPAPLGASSAHLLLTRLTTLRYLRADAHANALAAAKLDPAEAVALSALWRDEEAPDDDESARDALERLHVRGLAEPADGGWRITAAGRTLRDAVEDETDRGAALPFGALDDAERAAFLSHLEALPD